MDFSFSETQLQLGESVRRLLHKFASSQLMRESLAREPHGFDRALWQQLAELGALAIAIPEAHGGLGMSDMDLCIVAEAMGRALPRVPFASTIYWSAEALVRFGTPLQQARWLPALASGKATASYVDMAMDGGPAIAATADRLTGTLPVVADGMAADLLILASSDAVWLIEMGAPGVSRRALETIDLLQPSARVELDNVQAERMTAGSIPHDLPRLRDRAAVVLAFEQVGGSDAAIEGAVEYAKERKAFGRAIGSFQAVKHLLANMYVSNALSRSNTYYAGWALATEDPTLPLAAATAHVSATKTYRQCAADAIQVHGGVGFTWEFDCHFRYRRANRLAVSLGPARMWEDRLLDALAVRFKTAGGGK